MKRSILLSLLVVGVMASLIAAATSAAFTDTVTSNTNSFAAGTLDLSVDGSCDDSNGGPCDIGTVSFAGTGDPLNLAPGESVSKDFSLTNSGSLGFDYATTTSGGDSCYTVDVTGGDASDGTGQILAGGAADTVTVTVSMPAGVGNACQGALLTLDVTFSATQLPA